MRGIILICGIMLSGAVFSAPLNDQFTNAVVIIGSSGSSAAVDTAAATAEAGEPAHAGSAASHSVWWKYTAPTNGVLILDTLGSNENLDTVLGVYTGSAVSDLTEVVSNDDDRGDDFSRSKARLTILPGETVWIAVDGYGGDTGNAVLSWDFLSIGAGLGSDAFADATTLNGSDRSSAVTDTGAATAETGEPVHAYSDASHSVWWKYVAPADGLLTIDTLASDEDFNTVLGVYIGSAVNSLTEVAFNDNEDTDDYSRSEVSLIVSQSATYWVAVDGYDGDTGNAVLCWALKEAQTFYVSTNGTSVAPYTNWVTAATNIQDAVDVASAGDTVLVTNGTYLLTEEIPVGKAITIESVNGDGVTVVDGQNAHRCFNIDYATTCVIRGFTIQNGNAGSGYGGGIMCAYYDTTPIIANCTLSGNSAERGGGSYGCTLNNCTLSGNSAVDNGGGNYGGTLNNCTLSGNSADDDGGGCYHGTLNNCTLSGNSAQRNGGGGNDSTLNNCMLYGNSSDVSGGGSYGDTLNNCTLYGNSSDVSGGGSCAGTLKNCIIWSNTVAGSGDNWTNCPSSYCCTTPLPLGVGNITNVPLFADAAFRLLPGSPCVDAGSNAFVSAGTDLDGNPRIIHGTVDMGCFEYVGFITDSDGDDVSDYNEYVADTGATDSNDWFCITSFINSTVFFDSSSNRLYTLQSCTNLIEGVWTNLPAQTDVTGSGGTDSFMDSFSNTNPACYYRIQVEIP